MTIICIHFITFYTHVSLFILNFIIFDKQQKKTDILLYSQFWVLYCMFSILFFLTLPKKKKLQKNNSFLITM